jgi:hypothetical protein
VRQIDLEAPANFSADRRHRYSLYRHLGGNGPILVSCGYNPSISDEHGATDRTVAREIDFAKRWNYSVLIKVDAFAGVDADPDALATMDDPVGPENDEYIFGAVAYAQRHGGTLLAAWGAPKGKAVTKRKALERFQKLMLVPGWNVLKILKHGHPAHPLYLRKDLPLLPWAMSA